MRLSQVETRMLDIPGVLDVQGTRLNGGLANVSTGEEGDPVLGVMSHGAESCWPEYPGAPGVPALAGAEEPGLTAAGPPLRRAPDDFYTATLTDAGCARWERLLGLPVVHGGDLAQRRFRIMTRMNEQRPLHHGADWGRCCGACAARRDSLWRWTGRTSC
ncbi:MAG: hypothetical protein ACLSAF_07740 [Intestinimonas sp.]